MVGERLNAFDDLSAAFVFVFVFAAHSANRLDFFRRNAVRFEGFEKLLNSAMLPGGAAQFEFVDKSLRGKLFDETQRDVEAGVVRFVVLKIVDDFLQFLRRLFVKRRLDVKLVNAQAVVEDGRVDSFFDEGAERFARNRVRREARVDVVRQALDANVSRRDFGNSLDDRLTGRENRAAPELVELRRRPIITENADSLRRVVADALRNFEDFERGSRFVRREVENIPFREINSAQFVVENDDFFRFDRRGFAFLLGIREFDNALRRKNAADEKATVLHNDARLRRFEGRGSANESEGRDERAAKSETKARKAVFRGVLRCCVLTRHKILGKIRGMANGGKAPRPSENVPNRLNGLRGVPR